MSNRECPGCGNPLTGNSGHCVSCEIRQQLLAARANRETAAWLDRHNDGEDPGPFPESAEQFGDGLSPDQRHDWVARQIEAADGRHAARTAPEADEDQGQETGRVAVFDRAMAPITLHDRVSRRLWGA